jgi:predicted ArsR family transcriptional regulator
MSKKEIANVVGIDKRNVHKHLKKLESNNKIESSQPDQKKFYRPSGTSSQDPLNQELSREQKILRRRSKTQLIVLDQG